MPDFGRWTNNGGDPSLNEVNRTDRFIDALASEQPVYSTDAGEAELAYLMAGWRDDVRHTPATAVVTIRDAALALDRATASRGRRRASMAVLGSVAAAVLAVGGFGAVIAGAGPDDPLYGLRTMLFGEQQTTRDDQVVLAAQTQLAQVQQLIDRGDWAAAQTKLQTMTTTVAAVDDSARQQELVDQWQQLSVKVETRDENATVPPDAPPMVLPEVPPDLPLPVILDPGATPPSSAAPTTSSPDTSTSEPTSTSTSPAETTPTSSSAAAEPSTPLPTPLPSTPLPTPLPSPQPSTPLPTPQPSAALPTPTTVPPTTRTFVTITTTTIPPQPGGPARGGEPEAPSVPLPRIAPGIGGGSGEGASVTVPVTTPPFVQLPEVAVPPAAAGRGVRTPSGQR